MRKITLAICLLTICSAVSFAQTEAEMKAWMDYMTPGEAHKMMEKWNGEWDAEVTMWMQPGQEGQKSKASCVSSMILGGRYQQSKHTGSFAGMPFEGMSTLAFDNAKKAYVSTWIDNMGTGIMVMDGTWDAKTKTMHLKGKQTDPMTGKELSIRETFRIVDDNTQVMEMYMPAPDGKEYKTMEIKYTRKK
jgi:hypothetical protein